MTQKRLIRRILVTGASGYVGSRLVLALIKKGYKVRCLSRDPLKLWVPRGAEIVKADLLDPASLEAALRDMDAAFYLVHSMERPKKWFASFDERDRQAAKNFAAQAEKSGLERIVYLGALGEKSDGLSKHLTSRMEVGHILQSGAVPTTVFRAALIMGAGGASFKMMESLVRRLPIMIAPRWVQTPCQSIAIDDALHYLVNSLDVPATTGKTIDIGGPDILNYREMMLRMAALLDLKRTIFPIPILTPRLSSYWVDLMTPVPASLAHPLIAGLKNPVVCQESTIQSLMPHTCLTFDESVRRGLDEEGGGDIRREGTKFHLTWKQWISAPLEEVFSFFGNPLNISPMTRPELQFRLIPPYPTILDVGSELNYELTILGVPINWTSRIVEWEPSEFFTDIQLNGPYHSWEHRHTFSAVRDGTLIKDDVIYELPLKRWTNWSNPFFVRRQLQKIFQFRNRQLPKLLKLLHPYP